MWKYLHTSVYCKPLELGTWHFETMLSTPCVSCVTCHVSRDLWYVTRDMWHIKENTKNNNKKTDKNGWKWLKICENRQKRLKTGGNRSNRQKQVKMVENSLTVENSLLKTDEIGWKFFNGWKQVKTVETLKNGRKLVKMVENA